MSRQLAIPGTVALAIILHSGAAFGQRHDDGSVIPSGREAYFGALVDEKKLALCEWRFVGAVIAAREARYRFVRRGRSALVTLGHPAECTAPVRESFCVTLRSEGGGDPGGPCGVGVLEAAVADSIRAQPTPFSWLVATQPAPAPDPEPVLPAPERGLRPPSVHLLQFVLVSALLAFLLAGLVNTLIRVRPWRALSRAELSALVVCLLLAVVARLWVEPFPADMQLATQQGFGIPSGHRWAAAYSAMLHLLFAVFPTSLDTVALANVALGCASVMASYTLVVLYFDDHSAALASAALLACQPISIRFTASDSAHVLYTFALLMALICTTAWVKRGGYLWAAQGAGWLAVCANARSEGVVAVGAVICVIAGLASKQSRGTRRQLLVGALLVVVVIAQPFASVLAEAHSTALKMPIFWGPLATPFFWSPYSPAIVVPLAVIGAIVMVRKGPRSGCFWLLAIVPVAMPSHYHPHPDWENAHRQCLPSLAMYTVVAAVGLRWLLGPALDRLSAHARLPKLGERAALALVVLFAVGVGLPHLGFLSKPWTHQLEFEFLQANLGRVEDGATIVGIGLRGREVGLGIVSALSREVGRDHRWVELRDFLHTVTGEPLDADYVFVESAACHAVHVLSAPGARDRVFSECQQVRERFVFETIAATEVAALPAGLEDFIRDPIPLGIHRIVGVR